MKTASRLLAAALLAAAGVAHAQAALTVKNEAFIQQETIGKDGKKSVQLVPPAKGKMLPGTEITYIVSITNTGTATAEKLSVDDPLPNDTVYVADSATGDRSTPSVSVDGGKTFGALSALMVPTNGGKPRAAKAEEVTHLRWALGYPLKPGETGSVSFKVRIK